MRVHNEWPVGAVRNADFVTHNRKPGRVLSFEVEIESLPAVGLLCVHEDTILAAAAKFGHKLPDKQVRDRIVADRTRLGELEQENEKLRRVLGILDGIKLTDIAKVEADMEAKEQARKKKMSAQRARAAKVKT